MKVFINDNNEIKAVGNTVDDSLKEIFINDDNNPFKDWTEERICCYKVRVYKGEVTMMTPYIDTRIIAPFENISKKVEAKAELEVAKATEEVTAMKDQLVENINTELANATDELVAMKEKDEDGLSVNDKINMLVEAIVVDETPVQDGVELPQKEGYIWNRKLNFIEGVPHIQWVLEEDPNYIPVNDGSDYTKAIEWHEGDEVTEGLWYNVGDDLIWQAIKSGTPESADDKEYFDIP